MSGGEGRGERGERVEYSRKKRDVRGEKGVDWEKNKGRDEIWEL